MVNLFGLRSTNPKALYDHPNPVGPENDMHVRMHANLANLIVCAWGNHEQPEGLTTLERIDRAIQEEFGEGGRTKDAILLAAGALVEIAKTLQWVRDEMTRDREKWAKEAEEEEAGS